ncbi:MAG: hypothetical protein IPJ77_13560 [Planctomycetes bacterium]|nr:hypothetical protein [Planctomycetota bacterium]
MPKKPHREHAAAASPSLFANVEADRALELPASAARAPSGESSRGLATHCADHAAPRALDEPPRLFAEFEVDPDDAAPDPRPLRWQPLLAGSSPREILARIVPEDPLGVRTIVATRLRQEALLLDADRVHLRALALCARWAPRYQGQPEIRTWLARLVDQSITELVREEQEELAPVEEPGDAGVFHVLALPLGLEPRAVQLGCRAFNRLPVEERRAFFELVLRARTLDEVVRECGRPAVDVARSARRALEVFAHPAAGSRPRVATASRPDLRGPRTGGGDDRGSHLGRGDDRTANAGRGGAPSAGPAPGCGRAMSVRRAEERAADAVLDEERPVGSRRAAARALEGHGASDDGARRPGEETAR